MAPNNKCPCGVTWQGAGASKGDVCPECGRHWQVWSSGRGEWIEHPAMKAEQRMNQMGRGHFIQIEKQLRRIERLLRELRPKTKGRTRGRKLKD